MADIIRAIQSSNMAAHHKEGIFDKWLSLGAGVRENVLSRTADHGLAAANVARSYGEAGITGMALAAAHVYLPQGLDFQGKMPLDLGGAILAAGIAIALPREDASTDARNVGGVMAGVFGFRKTYAFLAAKQKAAGKAVGGTFSGEWKPESKWVAPGFGGQSQKDRLIELAASL